MATVIVIEDDADLREILVEELEEAGNGVGGLAAIKAEDPDVIISDIGMPGMDGYQLRLRLQNCPDSVIRRFSLCRRLPFSKRSTRA